MADHPPTYHTLSRADLAATIARVFARRRNRARHQQALRENAAEIVTGTMIADELLAEGYEVRHVVGALPGAGLFTDQGAPPAHPAD